MIKINIGINYLLIIIIVLAHASSKRNNIYRLDSIR